MTQRFVNTRDNERCFSDEENQEDTFDLQEVVVEIKERYKKEVDSEIQFNQNANTENDEESCLVKAIDKLEENNHKKGCACCSKARRVTKVSSFKKGQHISMPGQHFAKYVKVNKKLVKPYDHHAIIKEVVSTEGSLSITMVLIHFVKKGGKFQVLEETKTFDLREKELYIIDYTFPRYDPDVIVDRAASISKKTDESNNLQDDTLERSGETETSMEEIGDFRNYNFFTNNCEHFATWCVVGGAESFQVQSMKQSVINGLYGIFGTGSLIVKGLVRLFLNSADELTIGIGTAAPPVVLAGVAVGYLIYCIVMTVLYKRDCANGEICGSCLKGKLLDLWLGFGAFGLTSTISFIIFFFAIPLMVPGLGIPLTIVLILLAVAFQITVPKLRKIISSPFSVEHVKVTSLEQIGIGDIISHRYFKLKHVGVVTEVDWSNNKIKTVHYALQALHRPRKIVEEYFDIDLKKSNVYLLDCKPLSTFPNDDVVRRAKSRIGETKWDMCSNRSDHFSHWAKVRQKEEENIDIDITSNEVKKTSKVSLYIGKREIHGIDELQIGDVVQSSVIGKFDDTGILSSIEYLDVTNERIFEIEVYTYSFSRKITGKKYTVNLNKDNLYVKVYNSALCQTMDQRAKNARDLKDKKGSWFTTEGFIENCIERTL